jgi:two-component system repressor protein LuxO
MKVGGGRLEKTDVRIVCATNRDPLAETRTGRFREDLFYRLHVVPIHMPPLRERGDDIVDLAVSLLRRYAYEENKKFTGFSEEAEAQLRRYAWPGNIRQLQNVIRNIVVMHDTSLVTLRMLPVQLLHKMEGADSLQEKQNAGNPQSIRPLAELEREVIERALELYAGNIARAASVLGVSPSTLYRKRAVWENDQMKRSGA